MLCWTKRALIALSVLSLLAPHAASGQPAENNTFEWRDFDLSGEADQSNPLHAEPRLVGEGIDWSVFGSTARRALALDWPPMKTPSQNFPKPDPSLAKADIDWSLYGGTAEEAAAPLDQPRTSAVQVIERTPDAGKSAPEQGPEPSDKGAEPALAGADIDWSVFD